MRVEALVPDVAPRLAQPLGEAGGFTGALDDVERALTRANRAEDLFAGGRGTLQEAAYERARADVALAVATAAAGRAAAAVQAVLNMQV